MKDKRSHIIAAFGTVLVLLLLFLLLWFVSVGVPHTEEDEGIEMAFGEEELGGGDNPQPIASMPEETTAPAPSAAQPSRNDLMTQDDPESVALKKEAEEKKRKEAEQRAEQERLRKEREAREKAERDAEEKRLAEQKAKEQKALDIANQMAGAFGQNPTPSEGAGATTNNTYAGNPLGNDATGAPKADVLGRKAIAGTLTKPKLTSGTQEGTVVVSIRVNASGKVISASRTAGTISEKSVWRACEAEAMKAKFTEGAGEVPGTITYQITL